MRFVPPPFGRITTEDLDAIDPYLNSQTVDDLAMRLAGLSGQRLDLECVQLVGAMLDDMNTLGHRVGRLEHVLVLALIRAAIGRTAEIRVGHA